MSRPGRSRPGRSPTRFERACVRLGLKAVPIAFRHRFGEAMAGTVEDGLVARRGLARGLFLTRSVVGFLGVGLRERIAPTPLPTEAPSSPDRGPLMDVLFQELRFAVRALRRRPTFTLIAVVTLALGIGATTAIFSVVNGVLLRPLDLPNPDGLYMVWAHDAEERSRGSMTLPDLLDVGELATVESAVGYTTATLTLTGEEAAYQVDGARVTGSLMDVVGVPPRLGRDLRADDNVPDGPLIVVVSHGFWQSRLGGDPDVVGTRLEIAEKSYEIIGVASEDFSYPSDATLWVPHYTDPDGCWRGCHILQGLVRLAPDVPLQRAETELTALYRALEAEFPETNTGNAMSFESVLDYRVADVRRGLLVLLGAVGVVLLIACANVANLLLVRASGRKTEVAVRSALGASPGRVTGGVLTESAVLAVLGAVAGLGLAALAIEVLQAASAGTIPRIEEAALDGRVLLFALGLTVLVTLVFGLLPALHVARSGPGQELGGAARAGDRSEARSRSMLLVTEVALSVVLLAGAGLFLRSLAQMRAVELGFDQREVLRFTLRLPDARYAELGQISDFYRSLEDRIRAVPGVEAVGSTFGPPLGSGNIYGGVEVPGRPEPAPGEGTTTSIRPVTPGFFETIGMRLIRGRGIESTDLEETEGVAVVNETFVAENFPDVDPIGREFSVTASFGWKPESFRLVGIVADVRHGLQSEPAPAVYPAHTQFGPAYMTVHVRARSGGTTLLPMVREVVAELDPNVPLARVETVSQAFDRATAEMRFYLGLVAAFAVLAIVMAGVGLYGVVSFLVSRRTREIGIRVALGAATGRVRNLVLLQGLIPAVWGVVIGVGAAWFLGTAVDELLYDVDARDPLVLLGVAVFLLGVTMAATALPARRATRVDPVEALRAE